MEIAIIALCAASVALCVFLAARISALGSSLNELKQRAGEDNERIRALLVQQADMQAGRQLGVMQNVNDTLLRMQQSNDARLTEIRAIVDEKLQKTLEERIGRSFALVNERLEQVYKGLGEMQALAAGVGDLKKVLTNVKTLGILGEIQLGAILAQILSPEQYDTNVKTKQGSNDAVEFAVKLPGDGEGGTVYLPVDSKFPGQRYIQVAEAYESGDKGQIDIALRALAGAVRSSAKDMRDKYLDPPRTTDFGILFLPTEGLYAEVVRLGLIEELQRDLKVNIAGPTTMAALLSSLQMGFRTLAIQKRSGEVWDVLGGVKTEFVKFAEVLDKAQSKINEANRQLDELKGTRMRAIDRKLRDVAALPESEDTTEG